MPSFPTRLLLEGVSATLRQAKLRPIGEALRDGKTILDVGVWCTMPEPHTSENWLEKQEVLPSSLLIAVGLEDMKQFHEKYPKVLCVQANGTALPFGDSSVDIAIANAVLEHVTREGQLSFVQGIARVVRQWALIAVPDRWCPVEIHSRIPLIHWLPFWRTVFRLIGQAYWASPKNLTTLFTHASLLSLLQRSASDSVKWTVERQKLMRIPISLIARYHRTED